MEEKILSLSRDRDIYEKLTRSFGTVSGVSAFLAHGR